MIYLHCHLSKIYHPSLIYYLSIHSPSQPPIYLSIHYLFVPLCPISIIYHLFSINLSSVYAYNLSLHPSIFYPS